MSTGSVQLVREDAISERSIADRDAQAGRPTVLPANVIGQNAMVQLSGNYLNLAEVKILSP
jgi:hypothetical protein